MVNSNSEKQEVDSEHMNYPPHRSVKCDPPREVTTEVRRKTERQGRNTIREMFYGVKFGL